VALAPENNPLWMGPPGSSTTKWQWFPKTDVYGRA